MFKIKCSLFIFAFSFLSMFSQEGSINNYKYIIVPERFEFQKSEDSFQINSLTKFLFNKYGFNVLLSREQYPDDLSQNKCLALTTRMNESSKMFGKEINFDLVNCKNIVVYSSKNATSNLKEFNRAYQDAIRKTFESLKAVNYNYQPSDVVLKQPGKPETIVIEKVKTPQVEIPQVVKVIPEVVLQEKEIKNVENPIASNTKVEEPLIANPFLTVQEIENGFNLVDNTDKLQYILQESSVKDVYIVKGIDGILFKSKNKWILEYYQDNQFFTKELNIKF